MSKVPITLAVAHDDRHVPFLEGTIARTAWTSGRSRWHRAFPAGTARHQRMLHDGEFEAAEISFSSYLMAI